MEEFTPGAEKQYIAATENVPKAKSLGGHAVKKKRDDVRYNDPLAKNLEHEAYANEDDSEHSADEEEKNPSDRDTSGRQSTYSELHSKQQAEGKTDPQISLLDVFNKVKTKEWPKHVPFPWNEKVAAGKKIAEIDAGKWVLWMRDLTKWKRTNAVDIPCYLSVLFEGSAEVKIRRAFRAVYRADPDEGITDEQLEHCVRWVLAPNDSAHLCALVTQHTKKLECQEGFNVGGNNDEIFTALDYIVVWWRDIVLLLSHNRLGEKILPPLANKKEGLYPTFFRRINYGLSVSAWRWMTKNGTVRSITDFVKSFRAYLDHLQTLSRSSLELRYASGRNDGWERQDKGALFTSALLNLQGAETEEDQAYWGEQVQRQAGTIDPESPVGKMMSGLNGVYQHHHQPAEKPRTLRDTNVPTSRSNAPKAGTTPLGCFDMIFKPGGCTRVSCKWPHDRASLERAANYYKTRLDASEFVPQKKAYEEKSFTPSVARRNPSSINAVSVDQEIDPDSWASRSTVIPPGDEDEDEGI